MRLAPNLHELSYTDYCTRNSYYEYQYVAQYSTYMYKRRAVGNIRRTKDASPRPRRNNPSGRSDNRVKGLVFHFDIRSDSYIKYIATLYVL